MPHQHHLTTLLFTILAFATATPTPPQQQQPLLNADQDVLGPNSPFRPQTDTQHVAKYLDAAPNTVGVLFMTAEEEGMHVWLPIGERVFTRDAPILPLHPQTARITAMVASTPERASTAQLDAIECRLYPVLGSSLTPPEFAVEIMRQDGEVRLAAVEGVLYGLEGWEVESVECS